MIYGELGVTPLYIDVQTRIISFRTKLGNPNENKLCVTDRSKSILLWWFFLFYVLVYKIFCAVGALCMFLYF